MRIPALLLTFFAAVLVVASWGGCNGIAGIDAGAAACVSDLQRNGRETGVDCGGGCPKQCGDGQRCLAKEDCLSGTCKNQICICGDDVPNATETGADCGGPECAKCDDYGGCLAPEDCASGICGASSYCLPTFCGNGISEPTLETNLDCGLACDPCPRCIGCSTPSQCSPGFVCHFWGACEDEASICVDGAQNGDEGYIDCGGSCCPCPNCAPCTKNEDCASGECNPTRGCAPSGCANGVQDRGESAIDCGGPCCPCGESETCDDDMDCAMPLVCDVTTTWQCVQP